MGKSLALSPNNVHLLYGGYGGVRYTVSGILIIVLARNLMALYGVSPNERIIWIALILLAFLILQRLVKR